MSEGTKRGLPRDIPVLDDKRPDHMGIWDDDGDTIWLPREHYPKRPDAIKWAVEQWSCAWLDVRCLSRWMRYTPRVVGPFTLEDFTDPGYTDDLWSECGEDDTGAFRVWRLEST